MTMNPIEQCSRSTGNGTVHPAPQGALQGRIVIFDEKSKKRPPGSIQRIFDGLEQAINKKQLERFHDPIGQLNQLQAKVITHIESKLIFDKWPVVGWVIRCFYNLFGYTDRATSEVKRKFADMRTNLEKAQELPAELEEAPPTAYLQQEYVLYHDPDLAIAPVSPKTLAPEAVLEVLVAPAPHSLAPVEARENSPHAQATHQAPVSVAAAASLDQNPNDTQPIGGSIEFAHITVSSEVSPPVKTPADEYKELIDTSLFPQARRFYDISSRSHDEQRELYIQILIRPFSIEELKDLKLKLKSREALFNNSIARGIIGYIDKKNEEISTLTQEFREAVAFEPIRNLIDALAQNIADPYDFTRESFLSSFLSQLDTVSFTDLELFRKSLTEVKKTPLQDTFYKKAEDLLTRHAALEAARERQRVAHVDTPVEAAIKSPTDARYRAVCNAIQDSRLEKVKELIEINRDLLNFRDKNGNTLLHVAVQCNRKDVVDELIAAGADITIQNQSELTPLQLAVEYRSISLLEPLLLKVDTLDLSVKLELINKALSSVKASLLSSPENAKLIKIKELLENSLKAAAPAAAAVVPAALRAEYRDMSLYRVAENTEETQLIQELVETAITFGADDQALKLTELKRRCQEKGVPQAELDLILERSKRKAKQFPRDIQTIKQNTVSSIVGLLQTARLALSVGNKAANLQRLHLILSEEHDIHVAVPQFQGIPHELVMQFVREKFPDLDRLWRLFSESQAQGKSLKESAEILSTIQENIKRIFSEATDFPPNELIESFAADGSSLMVRSTGKEDSLRVANPGGNTSVPHVRSRKVDIGKAMGEVVASYFSEQSLAQRKVCGDDITQPPFMPILVQTMVQETSSEYIPTSGVMFTEEGDLGTPGVCQISAALGHAEGVVTGEAPSDTFYVHGDYVHGIVREKPTRKKPSQEQENSGALETVPNTPSKKNAPCLTKAQLLRLAAIGRHIEERYGYPMDIEWSFDPKKNMFFIFQARPIPVKVVSSPSYIRPEKIQELEHKKQVTVIVAGGGRVCELTKATTLIAVSASEALQAFLKNPDATPRAILLQKTTAVNSHEAGFFRERGIPVIHVGSDISNIESLLQNHTLLLDTQESVLGVMPESVRSQEFIASGLRRHLAPKMESTMKAPQRDFTAFLKEVGTFAYSVTKTEKERLDQLLHDTFGFNIVDKLLNAFEQVNTREERAYILSQLMYTVEKRILPLIPQEQREELQSKLFYNAQHVWSVYTDSPAVESGKKFAMNWLRAVLLQRPAEGVVHADTLYVALGEVRERDLVGVVPPESATDPRSPYLDVFLRSSKFILFPEQKRNWNQFVQGLSLEDLQKLGRVFQQLGPEVVEIWLNSEFEKIWKAQNGNGQQCTHAIEQQISDPTFTQAILSVTQAKEVARRFASQAHDFGDPSKFDVYIQRLESELLPQAKQCVQSMIEARGFSKTLVSQAFLSLVASYDSCIKGLTGSPLYEGKLDEKVRRFEKMLEGYLQLTQAVLAPGVLSHDPLLQKQADNLSRGLPYYFDLVKSRVERQQISLEAALRASPSFSVGMTALGSGLGRPERSQPFSFEDFFMTLHQSLLTAGASIGTQSGISLQALPQPVQDICRSIQSLDRSDSGEKPDVSLRPTIQSIEYHYPNIEVAFNCPLRNHSAQFSLQAQVDASGRVTYIDFTGNFFCPAAGSVGRENDLSLYALSTYCSPPVAMYAPPSEAMRPCPREMVQFHWRFFPLPDNVVQKAYVTTAMNHLQRMIGYLQEKRGLPKAEQINPRIFSDFPWSMKLVLSFEWQHIQNPATKQKMVEAWLSGILDHFTEENFYYFYDSFSTIYREFSNLQQFEQIKNNLIDIMPSMSKGFFLKALSYLNQTQGRYWKKNPVSDARMQSQLEQLPDLSSEIQAKLVASSERLGLKDSSEMRFFLP